MNMNRIPKCIIIILINRTWIVYINGERCQKVFNNFVPFKLWFSFAFDSRVVGFFYKWIYVHYPDLMKCYFAPYYRNCESGYFCCISCLTNLNFTWSGAEFVISDGYTFFGFPFAILFSIIVPWYHSVVHDSW